MRIDYLSSDILQFRGDSMAALATAFIDGERVLLVDALASRHDALDLRDYLENGLGKRVEAIVLTQADGGHRAGVELFPRAQLWTCEHAPATLAWGRHALQLALGAAPRSLAIGVPSAGLVFAADSLVGNVAVLGQMSAEQADAGLARLQDMQPARVAARHGALEAAAVLAHARGYLAALRTEVLALRSSLAPEAAAAAIRAIGLARLLPAAVQPTPLELHWHRDNLRRIAERGLFAAPPPRAALTGPAARTSLGQACRMTLACVLTAMLGGLAQRGV